MAVNDEQITINVDAGASIKSLADLKKALKDSKSAMIDAEEGTEAYNKALADCARYQHQLTEMTNQIKLSTADFGQNIANITTIAGTFTSAIAGINGALNLMGTEGEVATETIKKMQSLMAIAGAFSSIDQGIKAFKGLSNQIKQTSLVTKLFAAETKAMTVAETANTAAIKGSTLALNGFKAALVATGIGAVVVAVGTLAANWDKVADAIGRVTNARKKDKEEEERQIALEAATKEAENEYKLWQRKQQVNALNTEQVKQYNQLQTQLEGLNKELEYYVALMKENEGNRQYWEELNEQAKGISKSITQIKNEADALLANPLPEVEKKTKKIKDNVVECTESIEDNTTLYTKRIDLQNSLVDYTKDEYQLLEQEYLINQMLLSGDTKSLDILKQKYEYERSLLDVKKMSSAIEQINADATRKESAIDLEDANYDNATEIVGGQWMIDAFDLESQIQQQRIQLLTELRDTAIEGSEAQMMAQMELDNANQLYLINETKRANAEKKLQQMKVNSAVQMAGSVTSILDRLAEAEDANTKEGFERQKSFQVASATINMLAGITAAISGLFTTKSGPWDIALAAAQATAIGVAGAVQIAKIKQQTFNGGDSGSSNATPQLSVGALNAMTSVPEQITATGESTESALKDNKVYVLESDITRTVKNVQVTESESTF